MSQPQSIKMYGIELIYRPRMDTWIACFGVDYFVHFFQPPGCAWRARKPFALEDIANGKTLAFCVHNALKHYEAYQATIRERVARKLKDPIVIETMNRKTIR